jgi:hypothetical protein
LRSIACAVGVMLLSNVVAQADEIPTNEADEFIKESCSRRAEEFFRHEWGNGIVASKDETTTVDSTNHYNMKLHACFQRLTINTKNKEMVVTTITIADVSEQRVIATYGKSIANKTNVFKQTACSVDGQRCESQDQWESQVAHYMQD